MILYIGSPKDSIMTLIEFIRELGKDTGYKINEQKSNNSNANNSKAEKITIIETIVKYLGINPAKDMEDLNEEN